MGNPTKEWFSHAVNNRRFPNEKVDERQKTVNAGRLVRVEKSFYKLPIYLPMQWTLPAVPPVAPIVETTDNRLDFDVLIVGAIADAPSREFRFKNSPSEINPSFISRELNINLSLADIAGTIEPFIEGQRGIFYYTSPFILYKGQQLTLEMFKKDATANDVLVNLVWVGYRIFSEKATWLGYESTEATDAKKFIALREVPRQIWLKQEVQFDANGFANDIRTPDIDEPLLIRGVRSTLNASMIKSLKIQNGLEMVVGEVPSWAVFCEPNPHQNFHYFRESIFLPRKTALQITLKNTIDGLTYDPSGTITWLCETV
jgi:hypothetical protein